MTSPLAHLEPKTFWSHFDQLRQIPRPSQHEEKVLEHIRRWAAERKWQVREDAVHNLCVVVPATKGHENARTVILQGHVDIVAEKDKATVFDFLKDPIDVKVDGDWVVAEHTTLGADNGVGVAAAMAAADDPSVVHGPLELLFTIDEETALTGASNLDGKLLKGRTLINMDSEEDGAVFVGCAGGCTTELGFELDRAADTTGRVPVRVEVTGLRGGHSGLMIHENRGNSLKLLARLLGRWSVETDVLVDSIEGGNKHNAIPREASAVVLVPRSFVATGKALAEELRAKAHSEIAAVDPELAFKVTEMTEKVSSPATAASSQKLLRLLAAHPHGVVSMSRDIQGLTETSTNLAVARTEGSRVILVGSSRSSVAAALRFTLDQVRAVAELAGAKYSESGGYPGWQPNMASPLLKTCKAVFHELRGQDPKVTAIHAGLECGIIGEKLGGADMISFGPEIHGVHAPGEKVCISSAQRFWDFTKAVLKQLA